MKEFRLKLRAWKVQLLVFFSVIGPGFITANVDNDAGGIYTYSLAGARYGYQLLWIFIPMTVALGLPPVMSLLMSTWR